MRFSAIIIILYFLCILFSGCEKKEEDPFIPLACFSYSFEQDEMNDTIVVFTNCSENAISYNWNFGDDITSSEENPSHRYLNNGLFVVSLTATNEFVSDTIKDTILVNWNNSELPAACFSISYKKDTNNEKFVSFTNCSENSIFFKWDFGDNTTSSETNPAHYYSNDGEYLVQLIASNETGNDTINNTIVVNWNNLPKACFSISTQTDSEEFWITYIVFSNCSENATSYYWDFGDGASSDFENPIHYYSDSEYFLVMLIASNEFGSDTLTDTVFVDWPQVDKPNIYLYPDKNIQLCLNIEFPEGGQVVKSIPQYNNGWCVNVDTSGKINNAYDCLFYESIQPDVWQYKEGWCVKREFLNEFFTTNMKEYGFTDKEIKDFVDYWIPRLVDHEYYKIYPQLTNRIEKVIQFNFSVRPDNIFRLFYGVIGTSEFSELPDPEVEKIKREGFTVVEWGVFRKYKR